MPVPNTFANATATIPLSQLDANFATTITLGNTAIQLGNTVTTLNNMTLANVNISSGIVTITNATVTTANVTTANIATAEIANVTVSGTGTFAAGSNTAPSITTSGDTNTGIFFPAADTVAIGTGGTERLRVDSAGNAGLAVTPSAWFTSNNTKAMQLGGGSFVSYLNNQVWLANNYFLNASGQDTYVNNGTAMRLIMDGAYKFQIAASGTAGNPITFTQAMTLDASGQLGIGYTSMNTLLAVNGNALIGTGAWPTGSLGRSGSRVLVSSSTDDGILAICNMQSGVASGRAGTIYLGARATTGVDDAALTTVNGIKENATSGNFASAITFGTANSSGTITERARITSGGGFTCAGIYNTTVGATNRDVFVDNGGVVGYVSSIRASKTNIQDLTDTSWLHQLNPVSFNYRKKDEEGNYTEETDGDIQYGMIAEDVEQVRPDLCFYDDVDGEQELRGIQYSKLVPVMLKEIQKLKAEIEALKGAA